MGKKTYVVFKGQEAGVYDNWVETHTQVNGYKGALYQKFSSRAEATRAFDKYVEKQPPPTSSSGSTASAGSLRRN